MVQQWMKWLPIAAIVIILGTHIWMLINGLPESQMQMHAILNLAAGAVILWTGYKGLKR